jgi:hypothetical protein
MGRPNYWPGPSLSSTEGGAHCFSFGQGLELLQMLHKRILELEAEIATFEPHGPPTGLQIRLEEVEELFRWMKPVEEDVQFGEQFIRIYRSWDSPACEHCNCAHISCCYCGEHRSEDTNE